MARNKQAIAIAILSILVVILLGVVIYAFAVKPAINGYVVQNQNLGVNYAISAIVQQIQQNGYAQVPVGNQTLILVAVQPQAQNATSGSS